MKTEKKIFIAFILNLFFSIIEFIGGIFTGSISIISDALHDFGDATSIGISFILEKKSKKQPDKIYTYGYGRYSILGGLITTLILLIGSIVIIYNAIYRLINPIKINYDGMLILSIVGLTINLIATYFTHGGKSINQKAVNLHMFEDVLGWLIILIGAILIRFTNFYFLDPILSILVAILIIFNAIKNIKEIMNIFLVKIPPQINFEEVENIVKSIENVIDVHHIHIWTLDGIKIYATMHVVLKEYNPNVKNKIKEELKILDISHLTIEIETVNEECMEIKCITLLNNSICSHH